MTGSVVAGVGEGAKTTENKKIKYNGPVAFLLATISE
jgi:hypothetical protein